MRATIAILTNIACVTLLAGLPSAAGAENTANEFWPEVDTFINLNPAMRLFIPISFRNHQNAGAWEGTFGLQFDFALKPVFRRQLRDRGDVFDKRFMSFRAGYQYTTTLNGNAPYEENRAIVEFTARYLLPAELIVSDRNRGEMRFINGKGFSSRYRNKLQMERDFRIGHLVYTPYISEEVFYDTRYDVWNRYRSAAGVQFPVSPHFIPDVYYLRQNDSRSTPPHVNVLGLKLQFYY